MVATARQLDLRVGFCVHGRQHARLRLLDGARRPPPIGCGRGGERGRRVRDNSSKPARSASIRVRSVCRRPVEGRRRRSLGPEGMVAKSGRNPWDDDTFRVGPHAGVGDRAHPALDPVRCIWHSRRLALAARPQTTRARMLQALRLRSHRQRQRDVPGVRGGVGCPIAGSRSMRRPQNRERCVMKWIGALACSLLTLGWIVSCFFEVIFYHRGSTDRWCLSYRCGGLSLTAAPLDQWSAQIPTGVFIDSLTEQEKSIRNGGFVPLPRDYGFCLPSFEMDQVPFCFRWTVPSWVPLVLIGLPTVWGFARSRSVPAGACSKCGYDLTGNVSGACPECGATIGEQGRGEDVRHAG